MTTTDSKERSGEIRIIAKSQDCPERYRKWNPPREGDQRLKKLESMFISGGNSLGGNEESVQIEIFKNGRWMDF